MALALAHITFVFQFHRHRKISAVKNTSTHPHTYASAIAMQCGHQKCQSILLFNALPAILSFSFFRSYAGWLTIHSTHLFPLSFSLILVVFFYLALAYWRWPCVCDLSRSSFTSMNDDAYIQPFFLYAEHNYKYNSQAACYSDKQENPPQKLLQFVRMPTNG